MILAPRYLPRLAATVGLFTKYGLADVADRTGLRALVENDEAADGNGASPEKAVKFRQRLVELGPAYIKLGQVLSTRPDLVPDSYVRELEKLQDDVPGISYEEVEATVEHELQARMSKLFESFEREPLGTASLGQVHAAVLRGGRDVVVKVQRPNIREVLADDLDFFRELATFLTRHTEMGARVDMLGVIQQLERALLDELDYRIEARNAATFRRALAEFPRLLVPKVIEGYTTERVLTTERVRGLKIDEVNPLVRIEHDFGAVAEELTRAYLKTIIIDGHFHADPHPGNVFVILAETENPMTPAELKARDRRAVSRPALTPIQRIEQQAQNTAPPAPDVDVKLAMIDFGMTARLSTKMREQIVHLLMALSDNRGDDAAETLIELGDPLPDFDRVAYTREIAGLIARNYDLSIGEVQAGKVLYEVINISYQQGLRLPAELTLLAKALFNLDGVTRALDPLFSPIDAIRDYANQLAAERARKDFSPRRLFQIATESTDFVAALPHRLEVITQKLAAGEFETKMEVPQLLVLLKGLQKVANRIFTGLVLAGIVIASGLLMPYRRSLATTGFIIAAVLGLAMVVNIILADRRSRSPGE
ncbi:MAG TPA: AarF/UbiB family protein [Gemmatimonadaceae bacterium]|nr:AarF/UbiB family protein [Gemmatimonadaceae bacterium]